MKILKNIAKTIGIIFIAIIIIIPITLILLSTDESSSTDEFLVNYYIPDFESDLNKIELIQTSCKKYCDNKVLREIECNFFGYDNIIEKKGEILYTYYQYINDSKEGGNVSTATLHYKTLDNVIYKIDTCNGPGKAISVGATDLKPDNWQMSINDIIDLFINQYIKSQLLETNNPYIKITIKNNTADCYLFS